MITGLFSQKIAFKALERYAGKLARTVLRGVGAGNSPRLPDVKELEASQNPFGTIVVAHLKTLATKKECAA
jgi:hypothetical protein